MSTVWFQAVWTLYDRHYCQFQNHNFPKCPDNNDHDHIFCFTDKVLCDLRWLRSCELAREINLDEVFTCHSVCKHTHCWKLKHLFIYSFFLEVRGTFSTCPCSALLSRELPIHPVLAWLIQEKRSISGHLDMSQCVHARTPFKIDILAEQRPLSVRGAK